MGEISFWLLLLGLPNKYLFLELNILTFKH